MPGEAPFILKIELHKGCCVRHILHLLLCWAIFKISSTFFSNYIFLRVLLCPHSCVKISKLKQPIENVVCSWLQCPIKQLKPSKRKPSSLVFTMQSGNQTCRISPLVDQPCFLGCSRGLCRFLLIPNDWQEMHKHVPAT